MTLRFLFAVLASLVLAPACNGNPNSDCDDISDKRCDDTHSGQTNDTPVTPNDPFIGDEANMVTFTFKTSFEEECDIALTCTSAGDHKNPGKGAVTKTITQSSGLTFTVDSDASCDYVLGQIGICETPRGDRPCHEDAQGIKWTKADTLETLADGEVEVDADYWFGAPKVTCVADGFQYIAHDVYVSIDNTFKIDGIAGDGNSWLQIDGTWIDYAGAVADAGYHITNVEIGPNSIVLDATGLAPTHIECTW